MNKKIIFLSFLCFLSSPLLSMERPDVEHPDMEHPNMEVPKAPKPAAAKRKRVEVKTPPAMPKRKSARLAKKEAARKRAKTKETFNSLNIKQQLSQLAICAQTQLYLALFASLQINYDSDEDDSNFKMKKFFGVDRTDYSQDTSSWILTAIIILERSVHNLYSERPNIYNALNGLIMSLMIVNMSLFPIAATPSIADKEEYFINMTRIPHVFSRLGMNGHPNEH